MDKVPIYLCCWHVFKAWCLHGIEKIKDVKVWDGIFQNLHDVMYMSINHGQTIDDFKEHGKDAMKEAFTNIGLVMCGQITFGLITINLVNDNCLSWFNIQNSFVFMLFTFVHCVYVCRIVDGGCSKNAPFQPRHPSKH
jgi:hypothetical protein